MSRRDYMPDGPYLAMGAVIALFWGGRLMLQYGVLDATGHLRTTLLRIGYHSLTLVFAYFTIVFGWAAL